MNRPPSAAGTARLFVSLPVPETVQDQLAGAQTILRSHFPDKSARWTPPRQIHLTLAFLGNVSTGRIPELKTFLASVFAAFGPLELHSRKLGCFPERGIPRVIWADVSGTANNLFELQCAVEQDCTGFGDNRESRAFSAHLTLGRVHRLPRAILPRIERVLAEAADQPLASWTASRVHLMRSELSSEGARHIIEAEFPLSGRAH